MTRTPLLAAILCAGLILMGRAESWVREDPPGSNSAGTSTQAKHAQGRDDESLPHPAAAITPAQAKAIALNRFEPSADGVHLRHRLHEVLFGADGVRFTSRRGELSWRWHFQSAGTPDGVLNALVRGPVKPEMPSPGSATVRYDRGGLVEQYVAGIKSIEQQFLIPKPLSLGGEDLVIRGVVSSPGRFEPVAGPDKETAWQWSSGIGVVRLGDVRVYDAKGTRLPASMQVSAIQTRIRVDATALAAATYPVTIDPEIGTNDFRLSDMGPDGDANFDANFPAVAYNDTNNEYLVVWSGDDDTGSLAEGEFEIFGQRIDAATGAELDPNDFRISDMGPDGDADFDARFPAVAYNTTNNQYLVVWDGDDDTGSLVDDEIEIYGQRIAGATGNEVGTNDFRISDMGPDGDADFDAIFPAVAYNATDNQYLVAWRGDDNTAPLVDNEFEIFGQRIVGATGAEVGANDFRISDMGPNGDSDFWARFPAVAYNGTGNEYLVVWYGDDNTGSLVDGEFEIYGQRIAGMTGAELAPNDFRISDMGSDGDTFFGAFNPRVAYNGTDDQYLVVWYGDDDTGSLGDEEFEIFGQRIEAATGDEVGANDFRISDMGPDGDDNFVAYTGAVVYNGTDNEYLVVWEGEDDTGSLVEGEQEIFGQRIAAATGSEVGDNDFRISDMGPDGDTNFGAYGSAVAYDDTDEEYLVVWHGDNDTGSLVEGEYEIFGQRIVVRGSGTWNRAYEQLGLAPEQLASLRAYRNSVLENDTRGRVLTALLYSGSEETLARLARNPALMQEAKALFELHNDAIVRVLAGGEGAISDSDRVRDFLQEFGQEAPPMLRLLTKSIVNDMRAHKESGKPLFGLVLQ